MKDYLVRGLGFNGQVRVFAACTTATVGEAQRRHNTYRSCLRHLTFHDSGCNDGSHAER